MEISKNEKGRNNKNCMLYLGLSECTKKYRKEIYEDFNCIFIDYLRLLLQPV